jgi:uroporphyrinogen decarboxylase
MNPSENFQSLFYPGGPERIPFTFDIGAIPGFTKPVRERFLLETGSERPEEHFDYDFRIVSLGCRYGGPEGREARAGAPSHCGHDGPRGGHAQAVEAGSGSQAAGGVTYDEWGIGHWAGGAEATYEKILPPLASASTVEEIEAYPAPIVGEARESAEVRAYQDRGYPVFGYAGSMYEWSWWLRGMERFMTDLILEPELAGAVVAKVASHTLNLAVRSAEAGIDVLCFYDDVGMQTGMQISPSLWRAFVKPAWRRILGDVRRCRPGVRCFLHSCGNITDIVEDIVDLGFDILHPVQPECMDLRAVERRYGNRIVLCSTVSAQRTLPFGTPEEVRLEVRRLKETFQKSGRTILCPSNAVQPETPWENVVAFAEEARRPSGQYGRFK